MGFSGGYWRLRADESHIDFLVPERLNHRPVGIKTVVDGEKHRVLYEVSADTCSNIAQIKDWCRHLSEKIWAEGTIADFRSIATKLLRGGSNHGKAAEKKTGQA